MASMAAKGIVLPTQPHDVNGHGLRRPIQRDELHGDGATQKIEEGQQR
jgi:hypothetical protein